MAVTVVAVARAVSVAAVAVGVWASGAAALDPSSWVTSLRDFAVSRDPSLRISSAAPAGSTGDGPGRTPAGGVERLEDTGCGRVSPPPAQQLAALRHGIDTADDGPPADQRFLRYPSFFYLKADGPVGTLNRNPPPAPPSNCGRTPFRRAMACCWGPGC